MGRHLLSVWVFSCSLAKRIYVFKLAPDESEDVAVPIRDNLVAPEITNDH